MFLALFASTSVIQVVQAETLAENSRNTRALYDSYEVQRGSIIASGAAIATSVPSDDVLRWQRVYVDGAMWAPVTGWINPALGSATGIEQAMNQELSGTAGSQFLARIDRILTGQPPRGSNVVLTLDAAVQRAAFDALGDLQGAVIAIEPATGRVLAMVSSPRFDTNLLASHDADGGRTRTTTSSIADPTHPLFNRAIGGDLNPPGSTFKLVVASAALASGDYTPPVDAAEPRVVPAAAVQQRRVQRERRHVRTRRDGDDRRCACGSAATSPSPSSPSSSATPRSAKRRRSTASTRRSSCRSSRPRRATRAALDDPQTALTGFGQGQVTATPLQMAMVSAGIANEGVVMNPRMVDQSDRRRISRCSRRSTTPSSGARWTRTSPPRWSR